MRFVLSTVAAAFILATFAVSIPSASAMDNMTMMHHHKHHHMMMMHHRKHHHMMMMH